MYLKILLTYLAVMTVIGFAVMGADKRKAVKHAFRVPESTIFIIAALGGSVGVLLGMSVFRHKTKHIKFQLGIPAILLLQAILALYLIKK